MRPASRGLDMANLVARHLATNEVLQKSDNIFIHQKVRDKKARVKLK